MKWPFRYYRVIELKEGVDQITRRINEIESVKTKWYKGNEFRCSRRIPFLPSNMLQNDMFKIRIEGLLLRAEARNLTEVHLIHRLQMEPILLGLCLGIIGIKLGWEEDYRAALWCFFVVAFSVFTYYRLGVNKVKKLKLYLEKGDDIE